MLSILVLPFANASACMMVCFNSCGGCCYEMEGDCSTVCCECSCTNTSVFMPNDNIVYSNNQAHLVVGGKDIPVASDHLAAFIASMNTKYPKAVRNQAEVKEKIEKEFSAFLKKPDDHKVSLKRIKQISKETGLKIVNNSNK